MVQQSDRAMNPILLSSGRSGTNYLLAVYAEMFPKDLVLKEIFRPKSDSLRLLSQFIGRNDAEIVELANNNQVQLWTEISAQSEAQGRRAIAKIFYSHTQADGLLMKHFREKNTVIHLIRRNFFDVFVSIVVAQKTGKWQSFVGDAFTPAPESFALNRAEVERFFRQRTKEIQTARAYFSGNPNYHEVFYEDIASDPLLCAKAIGAIFNVNPDKKILIDQHRQKYLPNSVLVTNYSEVKDLDTTVWQEAWSV